MSHLNVPTGTYAPKPTILRIMTLFSVFTQAL